jgi:parallel beta-helix repeat protein
MEKVGIQVEGGTPSIIENRVVHCKTYGIHIVSGAEPQVIDNEFEGCGSGDVNRE